MITIEKRTKLQKARLRYWAQALRSGKYKQTRGKLKSKQGAMCCLGVLCDLGTGEGHWEYKEGYHYALFILESGKSEGAGLPESIRKAVGLSHLEVGDLINLNDDKRYSFKKIAEHIETNLL